MKNTIYLFALLLTLCCVPSTLYAEAASPFSPEAPDDRAPALLNTYLPLLAGGEFEQAIRLNDLRGMRQYFLTRRLTELKAKNPELTKKDLEEMSAQIQLNDLNPLRLKDILLSVLKEGGYEGMTWSVQGYAAAPEAIGGYLVSIDAQTPEGKKLPILLGIRKLGEQWMVSPEIIEEVGARKSSRAVAPQRDPPIEVKGLINTFWSHWQQGDLNKAHALLGAEYRKRLPLLPFLQQAQEVIGQIGIPTSWTIVQSRAIAPSVLGLGVEVQGSKEMMQTIMIFRKTGETWVLEDAQFQRPSAEVPPAIDPKPKPSTAARFRPNLKSPLLPTVPSSSLPKPSQSQ